MTKSEFSLYAIYDHTGIARHLEEQIGAAMNELLYEKYSCTKFLLPV